MTTIGGVSTQQLLNIVENIEVLEEDKTKRSEQVKEAFTNAKSQGFDVKALREVIRMRQMKREELAHQEEVLNLYRQALGI